MGRATSRLITGSDTLCIELEISADSRNPEAKLLREASKLLRRIQPAAATVSGITWMGDPIDIYRLTLYCQSINEGGLGDLIDAYHAFTEYVE